MQSSRSARLARLMSATVAVATFAILSSCKDDVHTPTGLAASVRASSDIVPERGDASEGPSAARLSDNALWLQIDSGRGRAIVGIKAIGSRRGVYKGRRLIAREQWKTIAERIGRMRGIELIETDTVLPNALISIGDRAAFAALRRLPDVDYLQSDRISDFVPQSSMGCGWSANTEPLIGLSGPGLATNDLMSAKLREMNVDRAWHYATGEGATVGLVDTGIQGPAYEMRGSFSSGLSSGRTLTEYSYLGNSSCAHGVRMAGIIAAPRDGDGTVGIAWKANMVSVMTHSSVWISGAEMYIGASAYTVSAGLQLAAQSGAKVIAMAWGTGIWNPTIADRIADLHANSDVFFVAAAGTCGLGDLNMFFVCRDDMTLFPARMSQVFSASSVNSVGGLPAEVWDATKIDAVGYVPMTTTGPTAQLASFGGSSSGTAVMAGVATLVRSRYPMMSAAGVMQRMNASKGNHCSANYSRGNNLINAEAAVGGICAQIQGILEVVFDRSEYDPRQTQSVNYSLSVRGDGAKHAMWGDHSTATAPAGVTLFSIHAVTFALSCPRFRGHAATLLHVRNLSGSRSPA